MALIPVFAFVGNWICRLNGEWDVEFVEGLYAKSVDISGVDTLDGLQAMLAGVFDINRNENTLQLSYWTPDLEIYRSYPQSEELRVPPVDMLDDEDVRQLLALVARGTNSNLLIAIEIGENSSQRVNENEEESKAEDESETLSKDPQGPRR